MKSLPLGEVYQRLEPGPVVLLTTAHRGRLSIGLTSVSAERVAAPLVAECFVNLECQVSDRRLVNKYNLFVLEVLKAWIDPKRKNAETLHHKGYGHFVIDGKTVVLRSRMP